jgi:hypothetical protein
VSKLVFHQKVFDGGLSGTTVAYSLPQFDPVLARAVRWYLLARVTQVTGTNPKITVNLAHSNTGMPSEFKNMMSSPTINAFVLTANSINLVDGSLRHTDTFPSTCPVPGAFLRAELNMVAADNNANVELWITGRTDN